MRVRDILDIQNNRMANTDKAKLITRLLKLRAKRNNPIDTEVPTGWNASPYPASLTRAGGSLPG